MHGTPERGLVLGDKLDPVPVRRGNKARWVGIASNGVTVNVVVFLNPEVIKHAHEDKIEFSVSQKEARAHPIAQSVREQGRIGILQPTLNSEFFRVSPDFFIYRCLKFPLLVLSLEVHYY